MSHIFAALAGVVITLLVLELLRWWNERGWRRHDIYWDGEE